jgi:putative DNA primase/helicase
MSQTDETPQTAARRLAHTAIAKGFEPSGLHVYSDTDGAPLFWRIRAKHANGDKWIRPMRWNGRAFVVGEPTALPNGKPLYRLPDLRGDGVAFVVEGETCADALAGLGLSATTSGSADSADATDWTPLRGRHVVIWRDNDAAGLRYAETVTAKLRGIAAVIDWLDLAPLVLPDKCDCVDWLAMHPNANASDVLALARTPAPETPAPTHASAPRVTLRRGCDVEPIPVDWLWSGWLAAGKLHLIGGAPGTGKTTVAVALAATVSSGGRWPDGSRARAGNVVIWSGEDDNADTLNPRLRAAGADLRRVHVVSGVIDQGQSYAFDPARDMDALRDALRGLPDVRLMVIDPIVSAIAGDSHKNAEVRRGLQPVVDLASELRCALLGVTHFSKGTSGRDPVERITGSLAFGALARMVWVAAKQDADDERPERRVLLRAKSNIGPDGSGFAYELRQEPLPGYPGIQTSHVIWGEAIEGSARAVLAAAESDDSERTATEQAMDWLRETLADGPMPATEAQKLGRESGFSNKAVRTARERLGIKPKRSGFGKGSCVQWALPGCIDALSDHRCPHTERASMECEGIYGDETGEAVDL